MVTRIMVFGTFDGLHRGHENMFRQARRLGSNPFLLVSVARDKNVERIKGHKPRYSEQSRLKTLNSHPLVDQAILGGMRDYLSHIIRAEPQIIGLGYDQTHYVRGLVGALKEKGLKVKVVRLKSHHPHLYKSSLLKHHQR